MAPTAIKNSDVPTVIRADYPLTPFALPHGASGLVSERPAGHPLPTRLHRLPLRQEERQARTGVISASAHGRSSPVGLVLQVLKRVLRFVDGRVELALELALVLLALSFALGVLVAGDGADGLLCAAADLVGLLAHCGPPRVYWVVAETRRPSDDDPSQRCRWST